MLVCKEISCQRGGIPLFKKLGFSLQPGEMLALKGHNGSGKSTLLMALAGILPPAEGEMLFNNQPLAAAHADSPGMLCYIGHRNALKPQLSVVESLAFWADYHGEPMLLPAALLHFGLMDKADIPCGYLSAGWQRRVALARLMVGRAKLWLLDEPFTHLDASACDLVKNTIEARLKAGGIVVMATHQLPEPLPCKVLDLSALAAEEAA